MEIIENTLKESIDDVLELPLFCYLGTVSREDDPRVSPLWYHWEDDTLWILGDREKTYTDRIERHPETAVAIVDFDVVEARVRHIGMRGHATLEAVDDGIVERKLTRYLGPDSDDWDDMFHDLDPERWCLIKFTPETVVARNQSYQPSLPPELLSIPADE